MLEEWEEEIDMYVKRIEGLLGKTLESGRDAKVEVIRLTLDPVKTVHRPLPWYLIVFIVDAYTTLHLLRLGFQHYSPSTWFRLFPSRPLTLFSKQSATEHFSYWYRPHKSADKDPVIGLYPYIPFLKDLIDSDPDLGILCIEILPISMRITSKAIPHRQAMLDAIYTTMASLQLHNAVLAAHSFGTVIAAHMIRAHSRAATTPPLESSTVTDDHAINTNNKTNTSASANVNITSYLLIDPIPILLHLPDVAYNFLYRAPRHANEWQLWYFASRDPDIARMLGRHFFWTDNVLWKDDLIDGNASSSSSSFSEGNSGTTRKPVAIVLAGKDQIIPAHCVRKYLTGQDEHEDGDGDEAEVKEKWVSECGTLEVLWNPELDHAMVFDTKERRRGMMDVLKRFTLLSKAE
ncbi:hypothetical protein D9758_018218 [Tetrapyrgos nigripes]|uniref:AB hydrolase-1 domain-containing protein n=1 Tax=Tetrapyrgos nigripes TaxID=182062 RepID=A0A8H5BD32_9AGAR|nr:hypothetical protein D9758_018218 [Tetrapyrgos nigripes]